MSTKYRYQIIYYANTAAATVSSTWAFFFLRWVREKIQKLSDRSPSGKKIRSRHLDTPAAYKTQTYLLVVFPAFQIFNSHAPGPKVCWNSPSPLTLTGVAARTDSPRGWDETTPPSPKKSPGPMEATLFDVVYMTHTNTRKKKKKTENRGSQTYIQTNKQTDKKK